MKNTNAFFMKEIEELIALIKKHKNLPFIVEGENDKKALERFGVRKIFTLSRKSLYEVADELAKNNKECIILTDLDAKGRELYSKLSKYLQSMSIRINNELRNYLFKETKLRQIEGLTNYLNKICSANLKGKNV
ncbi:toprim domain-containing protein [Candidatus Woesearchaeota archaeon]|nr:toprim domain-containing protein [Candidatus Woesearchaeota archaeon]